MQTLNKKDLQDVEGGIWPLLLAGFIAGVGLGMAVGNSGECTESLENDDGC